MGKNQSLEEQPYRLILASTSKYRGQLLSQLGWEFDAIAPGVDEEKIKTIGLAPDALALELSKLKAQAVSCKYPHACVIGSDQVCSLDGKIFDKPGSAEVATEQLSIMQGKSHELITAVSILHPDGIETILNKTILHMRPLTLAQIHAYVKADQPLDCAGSYKLESRGIKLFSKIEMEDHTAIIGLPLIAVTNTLLKLGYSL